MMPYSATKSFIDYLAIGLSYELKDKMDIITFDCGRTNTNSMLLEGKENFLTPH